MALRVFFLIFMANILKFTDVVNCGFQLWFSYLLKIHLKATVAVNLSVCKLKYMVRCSV